MNKTLKQVLFWTPRLAGIVFILFISIFAFDVFDRQLNFWETVIALFMHLVPSILLTIAVVIAWRREWVGAVIFIVWAIWYMAGMRGFEWFVYVMIAGPPALIGFVFLAGWVWRKQIREA